MRVQGPGTNEFKQSYWLKALNWSQRPLDRVQDQKVAKIEAKPTKWHCFGGKINWFGPKNSAKRRAPDLENQESGEGRRYSPTQGFNWVQISPNWFLGNWTLDPV